LGITITSRRRAIDGVAHDLSLPVNFDHACGSEHVESDTLFVINLNSAHSMTLIPSSKTLLYHMFLEMQLISMAQAGWDRNPGILQQTHSDPESISP
jgi:hypothetical protein